MWYFTNDLLLFTKLVFALSFNYKFIHIKITPPTAAILGALEWLWLQHFWISKPPGQAKFPLPM